jgi:hypothetical protein
MPAAIEVLQVRLVDCGNLRAFARVKIGCIIVDGCRVIAQPGQRAYCALPQQPARKKQGGSGSGWYAIVSISNPQVLERVKTAVLEAYAAALSSAKPQDQPAGPDLPTGQTKVAKIPRRDPQQDHVDELAAAFDRRGPDRDPGF